MVGHLQKQFVCFAVFDQDIYNINLDLDKSSDRAAPAEKTRSQFVLESRSRLGGAGEGTGGAEGPDMARIWIA